MLTSDELQQKKMMTPTYAWDGGRVGRSYHTPAPLLIHIDKGKGREWIREESQIVKNIQLPGWESEITSLINILYHDIYFKDILVLKQILA